LEAGVDVISVCTPTPTHAELAIAAMRAGKHVLCEKPIARTPAQAEQMIAVARSTGVKFMVGHVSRYEVDHRKSKQVLERGDLGRLRMGFQSITGPFPEWSSHGWFADVTQSGGPVVDLAIHSFDYLLWVFGSPVVRVSAVGVEGKINLHSYVLTTLRFEDGGMGLVETSWSHPRAQSLSVRTELAGTRGRLHWDYDGIAPMQVISEALGKRNLVLVGEDSFATEIADFVRCVVDDTPPPISGDAALEALRVSVAALEALETGRVITLPPRKQQ
jgi:predicted dehydrogenase